MPFFLLRYKYIYSNYSLRALYIPISINMKYLASVLPFRSYLLTLFLLKIFLWQSFLCFIRNLVDVLKHCGHALTPWNAHVGISRHARYACSVCIVTTAQHHVHVWTDTEKAEVKRNDLNITVIHCLGHSNRPHTCRSLPIDIAVDPCDSCTLA